MGDPRTQDADLRELLDAHAEAFFQAFHAPIQGKVMSYSTTPAAVVDAQPLVALRVEGSTVVTPAPILRSVPVVFPGGSIAGYTYPLTPGADTVALMPQDADLSSYVASGAVNQLPQSKRRFSLSDVIAVPVNLRAGGQGLPATAFAADGGVLWGLHYAGSSAATAFAAMANKVLSELNALSAWADAHIHTVAAAPGSTSVPTVLTTPPSSVACTKLKVI